MSADQIEKGRYFITGNGDIAIMNDRGMQAINVSYEPSLGETLEITKQVIYDSVFMKQKEFTSFYSDKTIENAPLTLERFYKLIRSFIIDEKLSIDRSLKKSTNKKNGGSSNSKLPSGGRKQQVRDLLTQGITSPTAIAKELGTNAGYVSRLIKEIG